MHEIRFYMYSNVPKIEPWEGSIGQEGPNKYVGKFHERMERSILA